MIRNLLLDWSGTLVNDFEAVFQATNSVFARFEKPEFSHDVFRREFFLPYANFYERFLPEVALTEIDRVFQRSFDQLRDAVELQPGAREFLEFCRVSGRKLYVVSTIKNAHFQGQTERLRLRSMFDQTYVEVKDKVAVIEEILRENGLDRSETLFVGDMLHDVEAAKWGKIISAAVLNGFDSPEKLMSGSPDLMVQDLSHLQQVMEAANDTETDWIEIVDQEVFCRIGVPLEERQQPQRLLVSVRFRIAQPFGQLNDQFAKTIDYAAVSSEIDRIAGEGETLLLETLAEKILSRLRRLFPMRRIRVAVKKFILPNVKYVEVTTER